MVGSEIENSASKLNQDSVDCKRSIFPESFCMLCKAPNDQDYKGLKINHHDRLKVLWNKTTIPSYLVLFYFILCLIKVSEHKKVIAQAERGDGFENMT